MDEMSKYKGKDDIDTIEAKSHKKSIKKTLVHLSLVYLFIFTAYRSLETIQSSLNFEEGLGTVSLSVLYSTYGISSLCIGPVVVSILKPKWTLFCGCLVHILYIFMNIWPMWWTLVSASVVLGIVSAFIWITQGIYINNLALEYSKYSKRSFNEILSTFLATFFILYGISGPLGSLVSSLILGQKWKNNSETPTPGNVSLIEGWNETIGPDEGICGPNHCPDVDIHTEVLEKPNQTLVYILIGVLLGFDAIGLILCFFLRNVPYPHDASVKTKLYNIVSIFKSIDLMLLVPMFYLSGVYGSVFYGSFTQSFISCPYGIESVGYAMMAEGIAFIVISLVSGSLAKVVSRPVQMVVFISLALGQVLGWLLWNPQQDDYWVIFLISGIFGVSNGILKIQSSVVTSLLFPHCPEAAFGQYNIWQCVGFITGFAIGSRVCFFTKSCFTLGCLGLMTITYIMIEFRLKNKKVIEVIFVGSKTEKGMLNTEEKQ